MGINILGELMEKAHIAITELFSYYFMIILMSITQLIPSHCSTKSIDLDWLLGRPL